MLALHSFTESLITAEVPALAAYRSFTEIVQGYAEILRSRGRSDPEDLYTLDRIVKEHALVDMVRRSFAVVDREEMLAATHNFLRFCSFRGVTDLVLKWLRRDLDAAWSERMSPLERSAELRRLRRDLIESQRGSRKFLERMAEYDREERKLAFKDAEVKRLTAAMEAEGEDGEARDLERLRSDLEAARRERGRQAEALSEYADLALYLQHMNRFSLYTRTRQDYEASVMHLTPEQKEVVDAVRPGRDFLVWGGAGTGKTIVLLHAFAKTLAEKAGDLAIEGPARTVLLTYTKTLVKYDRYLAEVLRAGDPQAMVLTADSFLLARLKLLDSRWYVDYKGWELLAQGMNDTGVLTAEELAAEVEDFLLGNAVTREEYVEEGIPRRGMRQPLTRAQREKVWGIRDGMVDAMMRTGALSKNLSRIVMIEHMEKNPKDDRLRDCDFIFLDESQDLSAVDLMALKRMAGRGLVMAGDAGQAIYGMGSPFRRAGIELAGRTRVLRSNFRNTCPIAEAAEAYRMLGGEEGEQAAQAFREGPAPELYAADTRDALMRMVAQKAQLFTRRLGYAPENVAVLVPSKGDIPAITEMLSLKGLAAETIMEDRFSFSSRGTVRISTLHSSKGLDFPVVLLYLPSLPARGSIDGKAADTLARNLIYVSMTRAMDILDVFLLDPPLEKPLQDLAETLGRVGRP